MSVEGKGEFSFFNGQIAGSQSLGKNNTFKSGVEDTVTKLQNVAKRAKNVQNPFLVDFHTIQ